MFGELLDTLELFWEVFGKKAVSYEVDFGGEGVGQVGEFAGFALELEGVSVGFPNGAVILGDGVGLSGGRRFGPAAALRSCGQREEQQDEGPGRK